MVGMELDALLRPLNKIEVNMQPTNQLHKE